MLNKLVETTCLGWEEGGKAHVSKITTTINQEMTLGWSVGMKKNKFMDPFMIHKKQ